MDDDELTRARRALRGTDPELDLGRVFAESRARANGPAAGRFATEDLATGYFATRDFATADPSGFDLHDSDHGACSAAPDTSSDTSDTGSGARDDAWSDGEDAWSERDEAGPGAWFDAANVEVLLRDAGTPTGQAPRVPRRRSTRGGSTRRGRVLAWGAAAAAAAVLAVSLTNVLAPGALPGSAPGTPHVGIPGDSGPPSPSDWMTPGEVVARAGKALSGASCGVKTRSTLGDDSALRFDRIDGAGVAVPKTTLDQQPLEVLQAAAAAVVLALPGYDGTNDGTDHGLALDGVDTQGLGTDELGTDGLGADGVDVERVGGQTVARIRIVPSDTAVRGGVMTRVELRVDTTTWLPSDVEIWAEADQGKQFRVRSELSWAGCAEPSMAPTNDTGSP